MNDDVDRQLSGVREELLKEFGERLGADVVAARFDEIVAGYQDAVIRTYVPVLAQRRVRLDLTQHESSRV